MNCEFCDKDLTTVALAQKSDIQWCGLCEDEFNKRNEKMEKDKVELVLEKFKICDRCNQVYSTVFGTCTLCGIPLREVGDFERKKKPKTVRVGPGDIAKYPFLHEAKEYISGFEIEIFEKPEYHYLLGKAVERIRMSMNGQHDTKVGRYTDELLTFIAELLILKIAGVDKLSRKLALSEAIRVEEFLTADLKKDLSTTTESLVLQILEHEFNVRIEVKEIELVKKIKSREENAPVRILAMSVKDYLTHSSQFHANSWKLLNRMVHKGLVYLEDNEDIVRLVRMELHGLILSRIKVMKMPVNPPQMMVMAAELVRQEYNAKFEKKFMVTGTMAPCVRHIAEMLNRGENVSHQGRILLASYMAAIGKSVEEISEMFKHAPDYNERITKQQVAFIVDNKRLGRAYHVSNCEKLKTYNLCWPDDGCTFIKNPMGYGREKR